MFRGIDINNVEFMPRDSKTNAGFKRPILEFTCLQGKKKTLEETEYDVPDQVVNIEQLAIGGSETTETFSSTKKAWKETYSASVSVSVDVPESAKGVSGSASAGVEHGTSKEKIEFESKSIYKCDATTLTNNVYLSPRLSRYAKIEINMTLRDKYIRNPKPYIDFINSYGTHYMTYGRLGGSIVMEQIISTSSLTESSSSEIKGYAKAAFNNKTAGFGGSVDISAGSGEGDLNEDFDENTLFSMKYYGGITKLTTPEEAAGWTESVKLNPWLLYGRLKPISELIEDRLVKMSMEKALEEYNSSNFLKGMRNFLEGEDCSEVMKKLQKMEVSKNNLKSELIRLNEEVDDCLKKSTNCYEGKPQDYKGTVSHTRGGIECQIWDSEDPHVPGKEEYKKAEGNYCRAFDGDKQPWCYTIEPQIEWSFCAIDKC